MTGSEAVARIKAERRADHRFIRSWGKDPKLVDIDFIDRFIGKAKADDAIERFELLDLEQMWQMLTELDPDKLTRVKKGDGEVIEWVWTDRDGRERKNAYPFSAEGMMTIMDEEFFA